MPKPIPGQINMTSTGTGNLTHVIGELFKMMAGVDMLHVPGRGEMQAQSDLLAGRAQVMFDPIVSCLGYIKAGQLRALGVTGATACAALPDVPTVGETVPGFDVTGAIGIGAPQNTPAEVVGYLNDKVNAALADPAIKARLVDLGFVPTPMSADGIRHVHGGADRDMGQGDPGGKYQAGVTFILRCRVVNRRLSRCGVTGSSRTAPGMPMASSMADAIAAPTPVMPLSPAPLMPSGLSGVV